VLQLIKQAALTILLTAAVFTSVQAQTVPGIKRDIDFDALIKTVDLDDPALTLVYKKPTTDGSSIGFYIGTGDKPASASFVPTNTSSVPEAEVVSYRLARFLGVSRNYYPVGYYKLGPKATATFREMVLSAREVELDRTINRDMVMKDLKANPDSILGIYRIKPKTKMYAAKSLGSEGRFNFQSVLADALRASGQMPTDEKIPLEGVKGGRADFPTPPLERQVELARQLSTIFVIDQLVGQWDRFWGNLEASGDKTGRLKLVARDNGGATLNDWEDYKTYNNWVSRYDRKLIEQLTALNAFLKGESKDFSGFTAPDQWKDAAGFIDTTSFSTFRDKLSNLIDERIPALVAKFGDDTFFPPKSPEVVKLDEADTGEDD
jgi:hypothetical protein